MDAATNDREKEPMSDPAVVVHVTTVPITLMFLRGQVNYIHTKGFDVHAISSPGEYVSVFTNHEHATVHLVEMQRAITPLHDLRALFQLWRVLAKLRPQIVHAHTPKGGFLGMLAAWLSGVPVRIYHLHGLPMMTAQGYKKFLLRGSERLSCLFAHQVLCVSCSLRQAVLDHNLCPPGKIKVLLNGSINGIDARDHFNPEQYGVRARQNVRAEYSISDDDVVIGFVGRIVSDKGIAELVEMWTMLRDEFQHLHLLLVGPFEPHDPIPSEIDSLLRSDPRIHLTGYVDDTAPFYAAMDILVFPSYREGMGIVALEASAMNLPVVATRIPGCTDAVVDGVTGILVPPRDAKSLAEATRTYLARPELRQEHGAAGRARVLKDFRPQDIWEATFDEYARLLREKGLPVPEPRTGVVSDVS